MHMSPFTLSHELPGHIPMSTWELGCDRTSISSHSAHGTQSPATHPSSSLLPRPQWQCPCLPQDPSSVLFVPPFLSLTEISGHSQSHKLTLGCLHAGQQMLTMCLTHSMVGPVFYVTGVTTIANQSPLSPNRAGDMAQSTNRCALKTTELGG